LIFEPLAWFTSNETNADRTNFAKHARHEHSRSIVVMGVGKGGQGLPGF